MSEKPYKKFRTHQEALNRSYDDELTAEEVRYYKDQDQRRREVVSRLHVNHAERVDRHRAERSSLPFVVKLGAAAAAAALLFGIYAGHNRAQGAEPMAPSEPNFGESTQYENQIVHILKMKSDSEALDLSQAIDLRQLNGTVTIADNARIRYTPDVIGEAGSDSNLVDSDVLFGKNASIKVKKPLVFTMPFTTNEDVSWVSIEKDGKYYWTSSEYAEGFDPNKVEQYDRTSTGGEIIQ